MGVMDAVMAGRVSVADLAGVTLGGSFYWPTLLLMSGTVMAVTRSVSQLHGAGRVVETGAVVRQAIWIAVCGGCVPAIPKLTLPHHTSYKVNCITKFLLVFLFRILYGCFPHLRHICRPTSMRAPN